MYYFQYFIVFGYLILHVNCSTNTTNVTSEIVVRAGHILNVTNVSQSLLVNNSAIKKSKPSRRLIIVNPQASKDPDPLRTILGPPGKSKKKKKKQSITSLLYQEMDDSTNELINEHWMYNLNDVKEFFRVYLNTITCENTIDDCDEKVKQGDKT